MKNITIAMAYLSLMAWSIPSVSIPLSISLHWHLCMSSCRSRRQDDKDDKGSKTLRKAPLLDLLLSLGIFNKPLDPDFCSECDKKLLLLASPGWDGESQWCPPLPIPSRDGWNCSQAPWNTVKTRNQEPVRLKICQLGPLYTRTCLA